MKRLFLATALILASTSPGFAQSSGVYVGFFGGATYTFDQEIESGLFEDEITYENPGIVFGGLVGYELDDNIRIELEGSYGDTDGDVDTRVADILLVSSEYDLSFFTLTAGAFFDLWPIGPITPYVGGGLGYAYVEKTVNDIEDAQDALTAFAEAGVPLSITPEFAIVPALRFSWIGTQEDEAELFAENLYNTQFRLGMRLSF